jgi:hypothetical protein
MEFPINFSSVCVVNMVYVFCFALQPPRLISELQGRNRCFLSIPVCDECAATLSYAASASLFFVLAGSSRLLLHCGLALSPALWAPCGPSLLMDPRGRNFP